MPENVITKLFLLLLIIAAPCTAGGCTETTAAYQSQKTDTDSADTILRQLNEKTSSLKFYQAQVQYLFSQPLFESQTLRKGILYYQKDNEESKLRINFQTLKQDDEKEQKYREEYIFDGVWLTYIDYQNKQVKRYQQTEPNEPADAFELVRRNFPIIGFTKTVELKKEFEIKLVKQRKDKPENFIHLHLNVKLDSIYKNDYTSIDFWLDKKLYLPAKIVATSTEEDIYKIEFLNPKVNKAIDKKIFEFKIPKGFSAEVIPLKKKD